MGKVTLQVVRFRYVAQWGVIYIGHTGTVTITLPISCSVFAGFTQSTQTVSNDAFNNGSKIVAKSNSQVKVVNNEQGGDIYFLFCGKA